MNGDYDPNSGLQPPVPPPPPPPASGKAVASLVLGILSMFLWLCPLVGLASSIVGLILGYQARQQQKSGMAMAGMILSVLGLIASFVNFVVGAYLGATGQHELVNRIQNM